MSEAEAEKKKAEAAAGKAAAKKAAEDAAKKTNLVSQFGRLRAKRNGRSGE